MARVANFTGITNPLYVSGGECPVDGLLSYGGDSYCQSLNGTTPNLMTTYSAQLWNGMRVLDLATGINHKLLHYAGTIGSSVNTPKFTDIEEKERVVVVADISIADISNKSDTTTAKFSTSPASSNFVLGGVYLFNAQTTSAATVENGLYICSALPSAGHGTFIAHPEYPHTIASHQSISIYCIATGETYRYKSGLGLTFGDVVYEKDDFINNGAFTRSGTSASDYAITLLSTYNFVAGGANFKVARSTGDVSMNSFLKMYNGSGFDAPSVKVEISNVTGNATFAGIVTAGALTLNGFAKLKENVHTSAVSTIDFALGNVFSWSLSANHTIGVAQTNLTDYIGSFLITIFNTNTSAEIQVTFEDTDNNLFDFDGATSTIAKIPPNKAISYSGIILTKGTKAQMFGVIAKASQNLTA